jgi:hypothetical protein
MKKTYTCTCCGGKNLSFDANGKWDEEKQEFVFNLEKFYFFEEEMAFCIVCDNWNIFAEIELE